MSSELDSDPGPDYEAAFRAAVARITELESNRASMIDALLLIARTKSGEFLATDAERLKTCCTIAESELELYGVKP